jgi:hypothetical protein
MLNDNKVNYERRSKSSLINKKRDLYTSRGLSNLIISKMDEMTNLYQVRQAAIPSIPPFRASLL